jgi:hypothetical protein
MKYTIQSSKYVLKNWLYLLPFAILPALFLSVSTDEKALNEIVGGFFSGTLKNWNFSSLFCAVSVLNFGSWKSIAFGLFGIVAIVVCVSLMMALMEKHMRIGKRTFNGIFSKLNDNLISTCGYALLLVSIYEVWSLLTAALLFFVSRIAGVALSYAFAVIVFLGMHIVLLWAISVIYLWLPCMQITGFKAVEALHYTNQLSSEVKWKISVGQLLSLFVAEAAICLCAWFAIDALWFTLLTTAAYSVLIMVYCVRMEIAYFDLDNIERADLKKYYRR